MKFCIDCKHYLLDPSLTNPELGKCRHKASISLVTGRLDTTINLPWCNVRRLPSEACGTDAKLFEAKEVNHESV